MLSYCNSSIVWRSAKATSAAGRCPDLRTWRARLRPQCLVLLVLIVSLTLSLLLLLLIITIINYYVAWSKETAPPENNTPGIICLRNTKSAAGEQFLTLDCRAEVHLKGLFCSQTPVRNVILCVIRGVRWYMRHMRHATCYNIWSTYYVTRHMPRDVMWRTSYYVAYYDVDKHSSGHDRS